MVRINRRSSKNVRQRRKLERKIKYRKKRYDSVRLFLLDGILRVFSHGEGRHVSC